MTAITKTIGSPIGASIGFNHTGPGGSFSVGFGIAPRLIWGVGHNDVVYWFGKNNVFIPSHAVATRVLVEIALTWPAEVTAEGAYDCLKFICPAGTTPEPSGAIPSGFLANWDDDKYALSAVVDVFTNLLATYH